MRALPQSFKKKEIDNRKLNSLLKGRPNVQHIELYSSPIGDITCLYSLTGKRSMYFNYTFLGNIVNIEYMKDGLYIVTRNDEKKYILRLKDKLKSTSFDSYEILNDYLIAEREGNLKWFLNLKDMEESDEFYFRNYKDVGNGLLLLAKNKREKTLLRLENMTESSSFISYREINNNLFSLSTDRIGEHYFYDLKKMKESPMFTSWQKVNDNVSILLSPSGEKYFYDLEKMEGSPSFTSHKKINDDLFLLICNDQEMYFFHSKKTTTSPSFSKYEQITSHIFLLITKSNQKLFLDIETMRQSQNYDFEEVKIKGSIITCVSKYGTQAVFDRAEMKLSSWSI